MKNWHSEELLLTAKLRGCGGTVFWFCYRGDRERIALFHRVVQAAGKQCRKMDRDVTEPAENFSTNAFLVTPGMRDPLEQALPPPPESWPGAPPENVFLAERYQLARTLAYGLEKTE